MKKYLFILPILMILAVGCNKNQGISIKKEESTLTGGVWDAILTKSILTSTDPAVNQSLKIFNSKVASLVDSLFEDIKTECDTFCPPPGETAELRFQLIFDDSVFTANENMLSVRVRAYTNRLGTKTGNIQYYGLNYDMKKQRLISNRDLLNFSKSVEINNLISTHFTNKKDCFTNEPTLENSSAINFNDKVVVFTYAPAALGEFQCGSAEISVPKEQLKGFMKQ